MPCRLIHDQNSVGSLRNSMGNLGKMQLHAVQVADGKHQACRRSLFRTDGPENPRGSGAQVSNRPGPGAPFCPAPGQLRFLADPRFVRPPEFDIVSGMSGPDRSNGIGELFLKMSCAFVSWR